MQTLIQREYLLFNPEFAGFQCSTAIPDQVADGTMRNDGVWFSVYYIGIPIDNNGNFFIEYFTFNCTQEEEVDWFLPREQMLIWLLSGGTTETKLPDPHWNN